MLPPSPRPPLPSTSPTLQQRTIGSYPATKTFSLHPTGVVYENKKTFLNTTPYDTALDPGLLFTSRVLGTSLPPVPIGGIPPSPSIVDGVGESVKRFNTVYSEMVRRSVDGENGLGRQVR